MNILRNLFSHKGHKEAEATPDKPTEAEAYSDEKALRNLIDEYGYATFPETLDKTKKGIPYEYLRSKEDLQQLWSQDIMAYMVSMPGAQGSPGMIIIATHQNLFFAGNYCYGDLTYADFKSVIPSLTDKLEDLEPWNSPEQYIDGWYWYGIHSGCWLRVHESIWQRFYQNARFYDHVAWIRNTWSTFVMEAIAARKYEIEKTLSYANGIESHHDYEEEDAINAETADVIAWRESDQGFAGLLCIDGKLHFRCDHFLCQQRIPIDCREEIRNDTLTGWRCYYCGLGHRVMIREDFDRTFRKKTYGLGKNSELWNNAFSVLYTILKEQGI